MGTFAQNTAWRNKSVENALRMSINAARCRAKKRGLAFTIVWQDFLPVPTHCPIFGTPLTFYGRKGDPNSASFDRKDNSLGYVAGNVEIISLRANQIKRDATLQELKAVVRYCGRRRRCRWRG